jgi:hypothetical protein
MAAAREIQDLPQLLDTCAGKIRGNSDLQIKAEHNRDAKGVSVVSLCHDTMAILILGEFNIVGWHMSTMPLFAQ